MREIIGTNTICCSSCVKLFCSRLKNLPCMMALCRSDQKVWNLLAFRSIFTIIAVLLGGSQQMLQPVGETDGHGPAQLLPPSSGFEHPSYWIFCSELPMICSEINLKKKNLTRIPSHLVTAQQVVEYDQQHPHPTTTALVLLKLNFFLV